MGDNRILYNTLESGHIECSAFSECIMFILKYHLQGGEAEKYNIMIMMYKI